MRHKYFPFKLHIYNFDFIYIHFGPQGVVLLKRWIDSHYRMIRTYSKLRFLKNCQSHNIFPQHITHFTKLRFHMFHHKAVHKLEDLILKFKTELVHIEIFDLYKHIHFLNKDLAYSSNALHRLLPRHVWNSITKHHSFLFDRFKWTIHSSHRKKFMGLLTKTHMELINKIPRINYTFSHTNNNFRFNNNLMPLTNKQSLSDDFNILIDPHKFGVNLDDSLDHTNNKWFINLSNINIPQEVSTLLQLGEKFCLPIRNKKQAIHEFIKDIESNMNLHNQIMIRNIAIPQFHKFIKNNPSDSSLHKKLSYLAHKTRLFCCNNSQIMFTRADKGNEKKILHRESRRTVERQGHLHRH